MCVLAVVMVAAGLPLAAQSEDSAERERALARELAAQQEVAAEQTRALAREFQAQQENLAREFRAQQENYAEQEQALARELSQAKAQLSVSAADIARLSAELSGPALRSVQNQLLFLRQRAVLGINIEDTDAGVRVDGVSPNGPAAAAGVAVGDTILAINDFDVGRGARNGSDSPTAALLAQMADIAPGAEVKLRIFRDGNSRDIVVKAAENGWPPYRVEAYRDAVPGLRLGSGDLLQMFRGRWSDVELVSVTPALGEYFGVEAGLLVLRAGRMGELGLRDGDVILEIGGRQPQTPEHAMRILASFEPGESLPTSVMRQRRRETLAITVPTDSR